MRKIRLTQGQFALVDDEDYEWLSRWNWFAQLSPDAGYYTAERAETLPNGKRRKVRMSRLILGLDHGDPRHAKHVRNDYLDNRRSELSIVRRRPPIEA